MAIWPTRQLHTGVLGLHIGELISIVGVVDYIAIDRLKRSTPVYQDAAVQGCGFDVADLREPCQVRGRWLLGRDRESRLQGRHSSIIN